MNRVLRPKTALTDGRIRISAWITVACDAILVVALLISILTYISKNNVDTYNQNVVSISNIADAKSGLMRSALENTSHDMKGIYQYCNGKSLNEILSYLSIISTDEDEYQLLCRDEGMISGSVLHYYKGYSTQKSGDAFTEIFYKDSDLALSLYHSSDKEKGEVSYSQGFTNKTDGARYFAVFCGITVTDNGESYPYYLVKPQKESKVLDHLQMVSQYGELYTAVCYGDGSYLARDSAYRSDNFYDYLYKYNALSADEKNSIRTAVQADSDGKGTLEYKDYKGRDCVFTYATCSDAENWHIIISVPVSEFVSGKLVSFFPLIIIIFLAILLVFNIIRLLGIVRALRASVRRERIASHSKSSFLSRMSHEIRTPLNAVIGYNAIAKNAIVGATDDAERRQAEMTAMDCLNKSEIASKHLLTVINDVLDMSSIENGKIQVESARFDFRGLITSLTTVFYSQAKAKGVDFEVLIDALSEEWFVGDQMRTNQILTNLLSNAIKFTPEGGKVCLKIRQPEAGTNAAHIHFDVIDTGIGMTEEYLTHIWTPFEQADSSISRRFGGSGLGLSITKNLVDLMGGTIAVESTPGSGTTFRVDLTFERTEQPVNSGLYCFDSVNALVVDDDSNTCDYIRLLFNRCGARCVTVTSGKDALEAMSVSLNRDDRFTVCLVDWRMPEMDGIETIRHIREMVGYDLPIIVLTAYDFTELADKAAEVGVNRFIAKPLFQSSLFDFLANICGAPSANVQKRKDAPDFGGARVLLAEDNVMNMEIAGTILKSAGLAVDSAWNGKEAVKLFEASEKGTYMAILMDVHMPEMNGHDATRAIRASSHPDAATVPIIAMTADAFAENVAEAYEVGMNGHIPKPIDIPTLFDTLNQFRK